MTFGLRLSTRERWLVTAAIVAILAYYVADSYLLPYWDSLGQTSEQIQITSKRVASYRRILHGQDSVKAALEAARQHAVSIEKGLLANESDALATAEMQGLMKEMVLAKGLAFRRSDLQPVKNVSKEYSKVSTRVELAGAVDQIVSLLAAIEVAENVLAVEEMRISPSAAASAKDKSLQVSLVVSALKRTEPASAAPAKGPGNQKL
jgi:Tfp pilus assembly protein PilO